MTIEKEFGNINDTNDSDCMIHLVPMTLVSNNEELVNILIIINIINFSNDVLVFVQLDGVIVR